MIELHGAGFRNKGAQLMLWTASRILAARGADGFCMEVMPSSTAAECAEYGVLPIFPSVRPFAQARPASLFFRLSRVAGRVLPASSRYARRQDADALIDISGFAFGDAWGARRAANFAHRARWYRRRGKPVIMLPQMFGPFEDAGVGSAFGEVLANCDRVYARDRISLEAARACGRSDHLTQAPDITIFLPENPEVPDAGEPYGCIVPNVRVLDHGKQKDLWAPVYLDRLEAVARAMADRDLAVRIVVHDASGEDRPIGEQLAARVPGATLFEHPDPKVLKGFLGGAEVVVGSRFHSLVAALSMGVPSLAMGWGHKYEMLLEDFGLPEMTYGPTEPESALLDRFERLAGGGHDAAADVIVERREQMRAVNAVMWDEVAELLGL